MAATSNQLKNERTRLQSELEQIKDRRIEATLAGSAFNESDQISQLAERLSILDEAITVAEKREEAEQKRLAKAAEANRRAAQREEIRTIAADGAFWSKKASKALSDFVDAASELSHVFVRQRYATKVVPTAREHNIVNDEDFMSDLTVRRLRKIHHPDTSDRRNYGHILLGGEADKNWSVELEPRFEAWARGLISILDREEPEEDNGNG